ncbi:uncharacterized protein LOC110730822 [Chenopodium quinoa]|uniref:Ovate family protein n=1 Tax=Chenopodium quinoa TaxID=63459 RepID=A0A803MGK4_CHEQI|nr:uncharacterized protein LOC110730822 [Chenopodium quinoa]
MDQVFGGCAQGAKKFTLVADPPTMDDEAYVPSPTISSRQAHSPYVTDYDEVGSNLGNEWDAMWREISPSSPNPISTPNEINDKGKGKRVMESGSFQSNKSSRSEKNKNKKSGGSAALSDKIDGMMEIIAERNSSSKEFQTAMVNMMNSMNVATPKYSVTDAMAKLCSIDDFDSSSLEFYYVMLVHSLKIHKEGQSF